MENNTKNYQELCKGNDLVAEADGILQECSFFESIEEKRDRAKQKLMDAAAIYKSGSLWSNAGEAYERASFLDRLNKNEHAYCNEIINAGQCYKKANLEYKNLYKSVIDILIRQGNHEKVGDLYAEIDDFDNAMKLYFACDHMNKYYKTLLSKINQKILFCDYFGAYEDYKKYAIWCLAPNNPLRHRANKFLLLSLICRVASIKKKI